MNRMSALIRQKRENFFLQDVRPQQAGALSNQEKGPNREANHAGTAILDASPLELWEMSTA